MSTFRHGLVASAIALLAGCGPSTLSGESTRLSYARAEGRNLRQSLTEGHEIDVAELRSTVDTYLGKPYLWGGEGIGGIDCSAFTQQVCRKALGIELPRTATQQGRQGVRIFKYGLMPGDLVFFGSSEDSIEHVGIYMGENRFVNATVSAGVKYSNLDELFWRTRYQFARRLPPPEPR